MLLFNNMRKIKILIITPKFPFPVRGACEQDRMSGLEIFIGLGYEIRVISKVISGKEKVVSDIGKNLGIKIYSVPYKFLEDLSFLKKITRYFRKIINPLFWDGASYEYRDKEIINLLEYQLDNFKPDVVWFEYSYLWPLYKFVKKKNIPIITRSLNFEAIHFLEEMGFGFLNLIKFTSKFLGEIITIHKTDVLFSITPKEAKLYKKFGAKNTFVLPLRSLFKYLKLQPLQIKERKKFNVFFMGSTYNVPHNKKALEMIVKYIAPKIEKIMPGKFIFNILGTKLPKDLDIKSFSKNVIYRGYIEDIDEFLKNMDIALVPSLFGAGMQQKIFEPLCRGIPTITSARGLAGYPFKDNKHLLLASNDNEFVEKLIKIKNIKLRKLLSENSRNLCKSLFSESNTKAIISKSLDLVIKT